MSINKFFVTLVVFISLVMPANAAQWSNNLRTNFLNNSLVIYAVNIRTFSAEDLNKDGIIEFDDGESSGNFVTAISRLKDLRQSGVNALHLLPITPVGKTKALGTAGSLYAPSSFNSINPQLKAYNTELTLEQQFIQFVNTAHANGIAIIVDIPSCGSYDLYLKHPELFVKDASGQPVIPADWTDVRLLNAGDENKINNDLLKVYKEFIDYMMNMGVDGIRADAAHTKPANFWKELIDYSHKTDPQFLWLAESSDSWKDAVSDKAVFTPYNKLLEAGFDGYYGSWFNLKDWNSAKELRANIEKNNSLEKTFGSKKTSIGSFATHDELSPILTKGRNFSRMIMWLNTTLPINSYYVDGFDTGDKYVYFWANKSAPHTYTDDDVYFVHRGKLDIFNFSRRPDGGDKALKNEFAMANNTKYFINNLYKQGGIKFLSTSEDSVFAYAITDKNTTVVVIGNLNFSKDTKVTINIPKLKPDTSIMPLTLENIPILEKGKMVTNLFAGEIQVLVLNNFSVL